jgi:golgin subfamily B member 1
MSTVELLEAFEAEPGNHKAFEALIKNIVEELDAEALADVYASLPEWIGDDATSRLLQVLTQQARLNKETEAGTLLNFHNGVLFWKHFGDERKAEMSFRKMQHPPADPELLREFYLKYYTEQGNWRRLEQFLSDPQMGGLDDEVEVKRYLGRLAEENDNADKAVVFWQGVHRADPSDSEAHAVLRRLYVKVGKWHAMVDLLKQTLDTYSPEDIPGKIAILREMVGIYRDHLKAAPKVVEAYKAILKLQPDNVEAMNALVAEYEQMQRWPDLVKILQQKVAVEADIPSRIELLQRIAGIMQERFNNATEAIASYQAILKLEPEHRAAITFLKELYESRRQWEQYVEISQHELSLGGEAADQDDAYIALAKLASERIRKPEVPIRLWERVRETHPDHVDALEALEPLYEREKSFHKLAEVLEKRVESTEDPATRVAMLEKLGLVYTSRLADPDSATSVWRKVLDVDPKHLKAQAELKKKYLAERDWKNLEWYFRTYATPFEWVRTLEAQAKSAVGSQKLDLLFKAAAVWNDELGETRRAVRNLENVLDAEPGHADAAGLLVPIYRELEMWRKLPDVYQIILEAKDDADERLELLLALADLHENKLHSNESAFFSYVQAVQESPSRTKLHAEFRRLAEASSNWETYVAILEGAVDELSKAKQKVKLLLDLGGVYRDMLSATENALECFNRVLDFDATNRTSLEALEALYAETGSAEELIGIYERKLQIIEDEQERKDTLFALAHAWQYNLQNHEEAESLLREMLANYPEETAVHDRLVAIYLDEARFADVGDVLRQKRDVLVGANAPKTQLADLECELGMLAYATREDGMGLESTVNHYEAALAYEPLHAESVCRLEELISDQDEQLRISRILEGVYRQNSSANGLADALEIQLIHAEADSKDADAWKLLGDLVPIYADTLAMDECTWKTHARRFALRPHVKKVRGELESLTESLGKWEPLIRLYRLHVDDVTESTPRQAINLTVAQVLNERLGRSEEALSFYHAVLDDEAEHQESLDALEAIYQRLDRPEELLDVYRRKVDLLEDSDAKLDYLYRISEIFADRLEAPEDAIGALQEALGLQPESLESYSRLDELYGATENWSELARNLEQIITLVADDMESQIGFKHRLAQVHETYLEDAHAAIGLYQEILGQDTDNQDAVNALERLFEDEELSASIADILEPTYERGSDWAKLIDIHRVREQAADDLDEKVAWNYRIAALFEESGQLPESAFQHFLAAATYQPGNEKTLGELLRLAELLENWEELVANLQELVEEIGEDARRLETHRTIADLALHKTRDGGTADYHLRAILQINPGDMVAVDTLIDLYREQESQEQLVDMLMAKSGLVESLDEKRSLLWEAGEICGERLGKAKQAIDIFENLRSVDPSDDSTLTPLEELYTVVEDWEQLVGVYRARIEGAEELELKKHYASLMGNIQAEQQGDLDDAVVTWRTILDWDAADVDALERLDDLYTRQEDWYNVLDVLNKLQELAGEDAWVDLQYRKARLFDDEEKLGDLHQGIEAYRALLERQPTHIQSVDALMVIVGERDEREVAFGVLRPVLRQQAAFEELWAQYQIIATHQEDDPYKEVATLHEMATLAEQDLADPDRAFDALSRAFHRDLRNEDTVAQLERLVAAHTLWEALVVLYLDGAENADDDFLGLGFRLKAGAMLMDQIEDTERAIEVYVASYEIDTDHKEVLERLHALYRRSERYEELLPILRNQADVHVEPAEKVTFLLQLAEVAEHGLSQVEVAYEALLEVLDLDENHDGAIEELQRLCEADVHRLDIAERLERIYLAREAWERLNDLLGLKLLALDDAMDKIQTMQQLADLSLERLDAKDGAIRWLGEAFRLSPDDEGILGRLEGLVNETGLYAELKSSLMDGSAAAEDEFRQVELWLRAAAICRDHLDSMEESESIYRLVLDTDDENAKALGALDSMYVAQERREELELVLAKRAAVCEYDEERMGLLVRLAELYVQLGDLERAIGAYREVLDLNDMHAPTLEALEAIYRDGEAWPELFEVLEQLVNCTNENEKRAYYTSDMARLAQTELGRAEDAVGLWEDVLMTTPNDVDAARELQGLLIDLERWNDLSEVYDREIRMENISDDRRLDLYKQQGRLWQSQLDDGMAAQAHWEKAREASSACDVEILDALRGLYRENFVLEPLAGVLVEQLESGLYDEDVSMACWRELAELRTESLGDAPGAIEAWSVVLDAIPGDGDAIDNLEQLFEAEARHGELVGLYRKKLIYTEDEEDQIELRLTIATLESDRLSDTDSAASTLVEILEIQPSNEEAGGRLERIYEAGENWAHLAQLLTDRDEVLSEPEDRLDNLTRLSKLHLEKLEDAQAAFEVLSVAASLVPEEQRVLEELYALAEQTGNWSEWVDLAVQALDVVEEHVALDLTLRVADIQSAKLEQLEAAVVSYERAIAIEEENDKALRALVALHTELESWQPLVGSLEQLGEVVVDPAERSQLYAMAAIVYEEQLKNIEKAVDCWEIILDFDPNDSASSEALQRIHRAQGQWKELIDVLERATQADPSREVALKLEIASIYEEALEAPDDAIEQYEDVLTYEPTNPTALDALKQIYGDREEWDRLIEVYERSLNAAGTDEERVEVCRSIALLYQAVFEDSEGAAEAFQRLLDIAPTDEEAVGALETIYFEDERFDDLVDLYEGQVALTDAGAPRALLLSKMAVVLRASMDDVDRAIHAYERLLQEDATSEEALEALIDLYKEHDMWEQVISSQDRLSALVEDAGRRLDLRCAMGTIRFEELHDAAGAAESFVEVLAENAAHVDASEALVKLYASEDRNDAIVDVLSARLEATEVPAERAIVHIRLASVLRDKLGQEELALAHLEMSVEACPEAEETLWPLAQHYMDGELWAKALPLLDVLVEKLEEHEGDERLPKIHKDIARCNEALYDFDSALGAYRAALELDGTDNDCVHGLARLSFQLEAWEESRDYYGLFVDEKGSDLSDDELADIYLQMGEASLKLDDLDAAGEYLDRSLDHRPGNLDALKRVILIAEAREDWEGTISRKRELLPMLEEDLDRFQLQMSIGDIYRERFGDTASAMDAYQDALHYGAFSKAPLLQLLQIFSEQGNFEEATTVLDKLLELEEEDDKVARWAWTAAVMCRDELHDETRTIQYLNKVLDHDIQNLEAFRSIDETLTAQRAWKPLEQNYRKMLSRVQKAGESVENRGALLYMIYKNLGEIYRSRLQNIEYAVSAFELAAQERPQDGRIREILAELYEADENSLDKAVHQLRVLMKLQPDEMENYQRLYNLYTKLGDTDCAWRTAGLLKVLGRASEDVSEVYEDGLTPGLIDTRGTMNEKLFFEAVVSPGQDRLLGELFFVLFQVAGSIIVYRTGKDFNLKKKDQLDLDEKRLVCSAFKAVSGIFSIPVPEVYINPQGAGIELLPTSPPILQIGSDLLQGKTEKELCFLIASRLVYLHRHHIMAGYFSRQELESFFIAIQGVCDPSFSPEAVLGDGVAPEVLKGLADLQDSIEKSATPKQLEQLRQAFTNYAGQSRPQSVENWLREVELSANHAAILASDDIALAGRILKEVSPAETQLTVAERLKDLVLFATSNRYSNLRETLGLLVEEDS